MKARNSKIKSSSGTDQDEPLFFACKRYYCCWDFRYYPNINLIFNNQNNMVHLFIPKGLVVLRWHKTILSMIQQRQDKKVALAVDTSTNEAPSILINNIVKLFEQLKPDTILVQADFKIRSTSPVKSDTIKYYTHGKSSYTLVLEWAKEENIDTLFYITDVTGFISEDINTVSFEMIWLVPGAILPRVPFGKAIKVA
jgi:hypothetical protein